VLVWSQSKSFSLALVTGKRAPGNERSGSGRDFTKLGWESTAKPIMSAKPNGQPTITLRDHKPRKPSLRVATLHDVARA
jgi:hypothetical protein